MGSSSATGATAYGTASDVDGGEQPSAGGDPEPCDGLWHLELPGRSIGDLVFDEATERLFAVGNTDSAGELCGYTGTGHVLEIDTCDGTVVDALELDYGGPGTTRLDSLVLDGSTLVATGIAVPEPREGLFALLSTGPLVQQAIQAVPGVNDCGELYDAVLDPQGKIWAAGMYSSAPHRAWLVHDSPTTPTCGFTVELGPVWGVAVDGAQLVMATRASEPYPPQIFRVDTRCGCDCAPTFIADLPDIDGMTPFPVDIEVVGGRYYVAGFVDLRSGTEGFVMEIDPAANEWVVTDVYLTGVASHDGVFILRPDGGERLFAAGSLDVIDYAPEATGTGTVSALAVGDGGTHLEWATQVLGPRTLHAMAVAHGDEGAVYVGGNSTGFGHVNRCDKLGNCG